MPCISWLLISYFDVIDCCSTSYCGNENPESYPTFIPFFFLDSILNVCSKRQLDYIQGRNWNSILLNCIGIMMQGIMCSCYICNLASCGCFFTSKECTTRMQSTEQKKQTKKRLSFVHIFTNSCEAADSPHGSP